MRITGHGPPPSGKDRNWKSIGIGLKERVYGWIAGSPLKVTVHQGKPSKPCLRFYKGKNAPCEKCDLGKSTTALLFVPFYPEQSTLRCVLHVHDENEKVLEALELHEYFAAWRGADPSEGVQISAVDKVVPYSTTIPSRRASADITLWYVRLVGMSHVLTPDDLVNPLSGTVDGTCTDDTSSTTVLDTTPDGVGVVNRLTLGLADEFEMRKGLGKNFEVYHDQSPDGKHSVGMRPKQNGRPKNGKP